MIINILQLFPQNLEQYDNVVVKQFSDESPPYVNILFPSIKMTPKRISFGSELNAQLEVYKNKLIINKIFHGGN